MKGFLKEIFTSIQGEGIRVGRRQTFIRFLGCNLRCRYCDTPESQRKRGPFLWAGKSLENPVAVDFIVDRIVDPEVCITGGEPLLQGVYLKALCRELKKKKVRIDLETNGTMPESLKQVIEYCDTVALDFKIPSATNLAPFWQEHEESLKIAVASEVFVKIVVDGNMLIQELDNVVRIIDKVGRHVPLVIQPVFACPVPKLLDLQKRALMRLDDVRVIPQIHKYLGIK
jgi:7-carboxy-7-deazaguanine synthase